MAGCDTDTPGTTETTANGEETTQAQTESETVKAEASKGTTNGMTFTQIFYLYNIDGYMASITVTIPDGYTVAEIEAMFR